VPQLKNLFLKYDEDFHVGEWEFFACWFKPSSLVVPYICLNIVLSANLLTQFLPHTHTTIGISTRFIKI